MPAVTFFLCFAFGLEVSAQIISKKGIVTVNTKLGKIRGESWVWNGKQVSTFYGVPYSKNVKRFSMPEPPERWNGIFDAFSPATSCYFAKDDFFGDFNGSQMWNPKNEQSEDCLQMNIYVPEKKTGEVLIWIYGGSFTSGSASLEIYDARLLAAEQNVIVVIMNYRVGAFGFLFLGEDSDIRGNMGLRDQQAAMRWVHKHVTDFGGDPGKVTLAGESAGSVSVTEHLFAPGSLKYFRSVILMLEISWINSWSDRDVKGNASVQPCNNENKYSKTKESLIKGR